MGIEETERETALQRLQECWDACHEQHRVAESRVVELGAENAALRRENALLRQTLREMTGDES